MIELNIIKNIIEASDYSKCIIDSSKTIVLTNDSFNKIFPNSLGHKLEEVSYLFENEEFQKKLNDLIDLKYNFNERFLNSKKEFGNKRFKITLNPINGTDFIVLEIIDIEQFAIPKQHTDILFEYSPSIIAVVNNSFNIVRTNKRFREVFGESTQKNILDIFKKKNQQYKCLTEECIEDGKIHSGTIIANVSENQKIYLYTTVIPLVIRYGKVVVAMSISQDITEINSLHEQLVEQTNYFHSVFQKCNQGIILISQSGKINGINSSAKHIIKWNKSRKPGINELSEILKIDINDLDNKEIEKVIPIKNENDSKTNIRIQLNTLEPSGDKLILLSPLEDESLKIQKRLNWTSDDVEQYYHLVNTSILEKRRIKPILIDEFRKTMQEMGNHELVDAWRKTFSKLTFADAILDQFSYYIEGKIKKRISIKPSTIIKRIEDDVKQMLEYYQIDIKCKIEYHDKITTNSDMIDSAIKLLIFACAIDLTNMKTIKPSIKINFLLEKYKSPYIQFEDNFIDTCSEGPRKDFCYGYLEIVEFLLNISKCRLEYSFIPSIGRKFKIYF